MIGDALAMSILIVAACAGAYWFGYALAVFPELRAGLTIFGAIFGVMGSMARLANKYEGSMGYED